MTQQSTTAQTPKESSVETSSIEATEDVMAAVKVPLTRVRKAVAKAMTFSATVPQFAVERAIQTQAMFDLRKDLPTTISVGDLINAAIVRALVEHPRLNASWHDDHIIEFGHVNLGVAVAVLDGLVVPAITTAEKLSLTELSNRRRELTTAAQEGKLHPRDLGTATISVSNLGTTGITGILPMVIPPQAAIIGLPGRMSDGTMIITAACDHRVVDGLPAAQFLNSLAQAIEDPAWMASVVQ
jgi:pyruvate dehydrogenase E2 component (dihydrolipoamide acetyltransferase)